jgi:hypothetical protein
MTDPSTLLKAADPLREESAETGLTPDEAQAIRREMIAAIPDIVDVRPMWRRPLVVAVAAAGLVASVTGIFGHRLGPRPAVAPEMPPMQAQMDPSGGGGERRQLQFSTPGGTRIIWIFDESLRLQEPMP